MLCNQCTSRAIATYRHNGGCPACSSRVRYQGLGLLLMTTISAIFIAIAGVVTYSTLGAIELQGAPSVAIGDIQPGQTEVIQGTIGGQPGSVVMSGFQGSCGKSAPCWFWSGGTFDVNGSGSSVLVDVSKSTPVAGAPEYLDGGYEAEYAAGDEVAVAGVAEYSGAALTFQASYVSTTTAALHNALANLLVIVVLAWVLVAVVSAAALILLILTRRRFLASVRNAVDFQRRAAERLHSPDVRNLPTGSRDRMLKSA
jgi:hypothetical protein